MNSIKLAHQAVYAPIAIVLLLAGATGFLLPFGILPDMAAGYDQEGLHVVQEASSGAIALGLLSAWCVFNFEHARFMHLVLLVFFLLLALLHWIDCYRGLRPFNSGLINSIPALLLIVLSIFRQKPSVIAKTSG